MESSKENCGRNQKVMYTKHCENTLRIEDIECINNKSHDLHRCLCTSRLHNFTILHNNFKKIF